MLQYIFVVRILIHIFGLNYNVNMTLGPLERVAVWDRSLERAGVTCKFILSLQVGCSGSEWWQG